MKSRSVALCCMTLEIGSAARVVCSLARTLQAAGIGVETVFPAGKNSSDLIDWCAAQGVIAQCAPELPGESMPRSTATGLALFKLVGRLAAGKTGCSIASLHYATNIAYREDVAPARLAARRGVYVTLHSAQDWDGLGETAKARTAAAARHATAMVASSKRTEALLLEAGIPPARARVMYSGASSTPQVAREAARRRLGLPSGAFVVSSAARLTPANGVLELAQACSMALPACPEMVLLVAGDGSERLPLEREAVRLLGERVRFLGFVSKGIENVYAAADIHARASWTEGVSMAIVEAAIQAVASVATDVGATREAVVDGETGMIVPPRDPAAMSRALTMLYADRNLCARMGEAARRRAVDIFSEERMAGEYMNLFGLIESDGAK